MPVKIPAKPEPATPKTDAGNKTVTLNEGGNRIFPITGKGNTSGNQ